MSDYSGGCCCRREDAASSEHPLIHAVILPLAGYPEISAGCAVGLEAILFEDPLRGVVV